MKEVITQAESLSSVELGRWLGRRDAFAAIAGRCSADQAESLRRIRDGRIYLAVDPSWEEFCVKRLGVSRRQIDRTLHLLDEFGPNYFHVAQMAHVTPEEYRRSIAPHVSTEGIQLEGVVIALLPENTEKVAAAVTTLVDRGKPAVKEKAALSLDAILKRCEALIEAVERLPGQLNHMGDMRLTTAISRLRRAAAAKGAHTL